MLQSPVFIGGAGRSGTTLLRVILDTHSRIACGPELKVLPVLARLSDDFRSGYAPFLRAYHIDARDTDRLFGQFVSGLLEPLRLAQGKARIAEKTPNNVFFFPQLQRMFPEARFIHVIRDGCDVVASLLRMDWKTPEGKPLSYTRDATEAARYWAGAVRAGRRFAQSPAGRERCMEIRYESMVDDSERALRPLFEFIGEDWEPAVLAFHQIERPLGQESSAAQASRPIYSSAVGRWQSDLSPADRAQVKSASGPLLRELGYAEDDNW